MTHAMEITPIARFHSPLTTKFGIPRQSGVVSHLSGWIELLPPYNQEEALRGLETFDYLWLIWEFSASSVPSTPRLTVRPPRLGGNERIGVFASRSPFRPNRLGLSSVRIERVEGTRIYVRGADLMDGTPVYDIKPYVGYADSHPDVRSGFVDVREWRRLTVVVPDDTARHFSSEQLSVLKDVLSQDPRPPYHDDPERVYGMPFAGRDVRFRVSGDRLEVLEAPAQT